MHPPTLSRTLPAWRIVEPAPATALLRFYRRAEAVFGVGWEYLAAINLVETGMGRIRGTSVAGAQGPMQFIPSTWAAWGRGDVNDPADAIMAAARYLAHNGFARPGGIPDALYRYNNSTAYVRGVTHYARLMERRPRTFHGLYHWQIYYVTTEGDVRLPVGYQRNRPIPVRALPGRQPAELARLVRHHLRDDRLCRAVRVRHHSVPASRPRSGRPAGPVTERVRKPHGCPPGTAGSLARAAAVLGDDGGQLHLVLGLDDFEERRRRHTDDR